MSFKKLKELSFSFTILSKVVVIGRLCFQSGEFIVTFLSEAEDTQNRVAVRIKCDRLLMPDFQLYLCFLNPHLELLSSVNITATEF